MLRSWFRQLQSFINFHQRRCWHECNNAHYQQFRRITCSNGWSNLSPFIIFKIECHNAKISNAELQSVTPYPHSNLAWITLGEHQEHLGEHGTLNSHQILRIYAKQNSKWLFDWVFHWSMTGQKSVLLYFTWKTFVEKTRALADVFCVCYSLFSLLWMMRKILKLCGSSKNTSFALVRAIWEMRMII